MEDKKNHNVCNKDSVLPSAYLGCCGIGKMMDDIDRCRKDLTTLRDGLRDLAVCRKLGCCGKVIFGELFEIPFDGIQNSVLLFHFVLNQLLCRKSNI